MIDLVFLKGQKVFCLPNLNVLTVSVVLNSACKSVLLYTSDIRAMCTERPYSYIECKMLQRARYTIEIVLVNVIGKFDAKLVNGNNNHNKQHIVQYKLSIIVYGRKTVYQLYTYYISLQF